MKKYLALVVGLVAIASAVAAVPASAAVQDGSCILHAYTPSDQAGGVAGHGRIDTCGGITGQHRMFLEVCLQVRGADGSTPFFVGSCDTGPEVVALSEDLYSHPYYGAVVGHAYRTYDEGTVGSVTAHYWSSWIIYWG